MARKPSDNIRDANRELKVQNQMIDGLTYSTSKSKKGQTEGWWRDLTVGQSEYGRNLNPDGFRIDWEERHHQTGLNLYERYTEGMSPQQRQLVDERLAAKGLFKGNNGLNRVDIPRRLHHSSKYPAYEGAHQVTHRLGIDSPKELERLSSMNGDLKIQELDNFIDNQMKHRTVAQQKFMEQFMLEPGNNSSTNVFGGNFSQQVLQTRDTKATAKAAKALKVDRKSLKGLKGAAKGFTSAIPGPLDDFVVGGVLALGAGGAALLGGASPAQAGQTALDTGVDIATGDLDGGTLANGELLYNQQQVNKVLQQGPVNTAAPTGDKKWDAAAQPFLQMLNGVSPTPKKPDFKQTAISAFESPR